MQMGSNVSNRDPSPPLQNFNIYKCIPSLRNFRHHITCIAAYDDHVLLGTKDGYILRGTLNDRLVLDSKLEVRPSRTRSPIVQIEVFPEFGIVISLSDKLISVCTLDFARIPFAVDKTCGATSFVTNGSNTETKNGNILKMCIVIGKKLMLFHWKQGNFHKLANDLPLREIPKAVAWFNDYICVCLDNEYTKIDYETGAKTELFTFGKQGPLLMPLEYKNELVLGFGEETYLMRLNEETDSLSWENSPIAILDDIPYLVALSSESTIEVQTVEPRLLVQKIENPTSQPNCLKLLVKCANKKGRFFVASSSKVSEVYCLTPEPLSYQIEQFLGERHFHLALNLNDESDETQDSKYRRTKEIEYQHALDCVQHNDLINSLIIFQRINADPIQVLELYSPYLEASGTFSAPLHASNEKELQIIDSLIDYLIVIRESLRKYIKDRKLTNFWPDLDPKEISNKKETLEQILDTMLLQCYLKKGDRFQIKALLRLPDNHCDLEKSEMALQRYSKYKELTILYERKGLHKKALDLLKMMSTQSSSLLAGPKPTVDYLKHLGADHLKLIFEYADWVIQRHPSDGLEIFSDDFRYKTGHLPKDKVVAYLESKDETLAILYLELQNENESTRKLEHTLIDKYIERAQALISDKFNAIRDRRTDPAHVSGQDELDVLRRFSLLRKAVGLKENLDDDDV